MTRSGARPGARGAGSPGAGSRGAGSGPGPRIVDGSDHADETWRRADLSGTTIRGVVFSDCTFEKCVAVGTVFADCSFTGCRFQGCDLSLARFPDSRFLDVELRESRLVGVDWTTVRLPGRLPLSVAFADCRLDDAILAGLNLRGLAVRGGSARGADFAGADLTDALFRGCDLAGARFADTVLSGADLRGATGYAIDPLRNRVAKARFSLPDAVALLDGLGVVIEPLPDEADAAGAAGDGAGRR